MNLIWYVVNSTSIYQPSASKQMNSDAKSAGAPFALVIWALGQFNRFCVILDDVPHLSYFYRKSNGGKP